MAERERLLKTFVEIEEEQRQKCRCDFSGLTAPLREYRVTQRTVVEPGVWIGRVILYRQHGIPEYLMNEEIIVFQGDTRNETKWALVEASEAIDIAKKLYAARS